MAEIQIESFQQVEQLIQQLYSPGSPAVLTAIEKRLQELQRSPDGWRMAAELMRSNDAKVRFFGALTFTVKLNTDGHLLEKDQLDQILREIGRWLVHLLAQGEGALVLKKLCSALATLFLQPLTEWQRPVLHVLHSLTTNNFDDASKLPTNVEVPSSLLALDTARIQLLLWFASILIEEVSKTDFNSQQHRKYHDYIREDLATVEHIIGISLRHSDPNIRREGVVCLNSWVMYAQRAFSSSEQSKPLRSCIEPAFEVLVNDDMEEAYEFFIDILSNFFTFFEPGQLSYLSGHLAGDYGKARLSELDPSASDPFSRLLLAYCNADVSSIVKALEDPNARSRELMDMMHALLKLAGTAVYEDEVIPTTLEFWNTLVEFITDVFFSDPDNVPSFSIPAKQHMMQAIGEYWEKIRLPEASVIQGGDSDNRKAFSYFRQDVVDLVQAAYELPDNPLLSMLADATESSLSKRSWAEVEASLHLVNALADNIEGETESQNYELARILGSELFAQLSNTDNLVPAYVRRTAATLLGSFAGFLEKNTQHIAPALNFLFASLEMPAVANTSAQSIARLCSSCRSALISELNAFVIQYERFLTWQTADTYTKEKVIGAVAAIIQALPTDEQKIAPTETLLAFIEQDAQIALQHMTAGQVEESQVAGRCAMQCLASVGKAMQVPTDTPVDLDDTAINSTFWTEGPGATVQQRIVTIVQTVNSILGTDGDVIEAVCGVLRSGFPEKLPGPFVLSPQITVQYFLSTSLQTPRLEVILTTVRILLASRATESSGQIEAEASAIHSHTLSLLQQLEYPHQDPEVASACINVFAHLMPRYALVLLESDVAGDQPWNFALRSLIGPDVLPKRAAASFWSSFLSLKNVSSIKADDVSQTWGPPLALALIRNFAGEAFRSDVDMLCDPLKKLIIHKSPQSKSWLEAALLHPSFPSRKVKDNQKRMFLQQVMSLRGDKRTNTVVKDFWLACKGTAVAYVT